MAKAELQEENKRLRKALEEIVSIKDNSLIVDERKEHPDRDIYPFMVGVISSIAKYALTNEL